MLKVSGESRTRELESLEARYLARKAAIRAVATLSWERNKLAIKRLGDEYHRVRIDAEKEAI
jgi:hypothetical protein